MSEGRGTATAASRSGDPKFRGASSVTAVDEIEAADARARRRYLRAGLGYAATISARAVSFVVAIVTVPLTLPYLGTERFGMWMTINSFGALLAFANLGIGVSLMNSIARDEGRGAVLGQRTSISNALALSVVVMLALGIAALVIVPVVPWYRVFNVSSPTAIAEAEPSMAVFVAMFLLAIPIGLANNVWDGLQRSYLVGAFIALGSIISIVLIALSVATHQDLPALVAAASAGPILALAASAAVLWRSRPDLRPSRRLIGGAARHLMGVGVGFFLLQVAIAVATSANSLVLAQVVGPTAVAEYSIVGRLFNVPLHLGITVVYVLWPALSEARNRGDHDWVSVATRRVVMATLCITVPLVSALVLIGPEVTSLITSGDIDPGVGLYVAFACSTVAVVFAGTASVFLNTRGIVWPQVVCWAVMATCNILLGIWLSGRIGTSGVVWATAITEGLLIIPLVLLGRRLLPTLARSGSRGPA